MSFSSDKPAESGRKNSMISKMFRDRKHSTTSAAAGPVGMVEVPDQNQNHLNDAPLSSTGTGTRTWVAKAKTSWRHGVSDSVSISSETTPLVSMRADPMAGSKSATTITRSLDGGTSAPATATQRFKSTSTEEQKMYDDLMVKAKSMSSQEFRAYVDKYKEDMEEKYRKQGGGVLGGEWIWRDPKVLGPW